MGHLYFFLPYSVCESRIIAKRKEKGERGAGGEGKGGGREEGTRRGKKEEKEEGH